MASVFGVYIRAFATAVAFFSLSSLECGKQRVRACLREGSVNTSVVEEPSPFCFSVPSVEQ